jgi:SHS2 domain-containing protein
MKEYEIFSTTADVGIKIWGKTYVQLYANAVAGFYALVFGKKWSENISRTPGMHKFEYLGDSCENVLVNFLSELIFLLYGENKIASGMEVEIAEKNILKTALHIHPVLEEPEIEVKSVTYHNLHIMEVRGIKSAKIVFDI